MRRSSLILLLLLAACPGFLLDAAALSSPPYGDQGRTVGTWGPPDIDALVPPVETASQCPLDKVLEDASHREKELVTNMQRFSATEHIEFFEADKYNASHMIARSKFNYVAYIHEVRPGQLSVEEYRDESVGVQSFPTHLASTGTAAMALILHPDYAKDFTFTCEGASDRDGRRAWQLRFAQTRPNNFRHYRIANNIYRVELKGRVWVDAKTFEVLRLETDLLHSIPQIPLVREHIAINYQDVQFRSHNVSLWLPKDADIYMDYRGKRYHHVHQFSDYQLFWVETEQKTKSPAAD